MNVLDDTLIGIDVGEAGTELVSLSALIARLLTGPEVHGFPALSADQRGYWWRFLVRCASRALRTADMEVDEAALHTPAALCARVRAALLRHSEIGDWTLHHADPGQPAFLQSPAPGMALSESGYRPESCALLTAIIGTREHERKSQVQRALRADELVFALVEYQTGVIFGGRGNYESQLSGSRSGAGSGTPFMGVSIGHSMVRTFRHDVATLLTTWSEVERELRGEVWALWREPWDGETSIPAARLDPAFIPYARMVRVDPPRDGVFERVWFKPSSKGRVADHTGGGALGDPFTPLVVDPKGGHLKVRGTLEQGYGYGEVVRLLFPRGDDAAEPSPSVRCLLEQHGDDVGEAWVHFEGLAFQQGKTRGFHRRMVRLPKPPPRLSFSQHLRDPVQQAHPEMLEATRRTGSALRSAFAMLMRGAPRPREEDRRRTEHVLAGFDAAVDGAYLTYLLDVPNRARDLPSEEVTLAYRQWLFDRATRTVFPAGVASLPRASSRSFEYEVRAEAYLRGRLRNELELPAPDAAATDAAPEEKEAR